MLPAVAGRVLVVGDVMEDIIVRPDGPMVRGSDVAAAISVLPGGSGANQAAWLAEYGVETVFFARVGAGEADAQTAAFAAQGITARLVADPDRPTGRLVTLVDTDGERSFFTDRGANTALVPADIPYDLLDGVGLLHVSGYAFFAAGPRDTALELIRRARERGVPVSLDPASTGFLAEVGAGRFLEWTAGIDICFANAEEAALLSGSGLADEQVTRLGCTYGLVVVKRGAGGALAGTQRGIDAEAAGIEAAAVDSTGAGDAFLAGFVAGLAAGAGLEACLARGNAAGARAVALVGGRPN